MGLGTDQLKFDAAIINVSTATDYRQCHVKVFAVKLEQWRLYSIKPDERGQREGHPDREEDKERQQHGAEAESTERPLLGVICQVIRFHS